MRVAVLSDIHSNHFALEACLHYIEKEGINKIIFLGDYVSDCPNPQTTMNLLTQIRKNYETWCIRGNREEYFIRHAQGYADGWVYQANTGNLLYTYENLRSEDLKWFQSLSNKGRVKLEGTKDIILAHGSLVNTRELLYEKAENTNKLLKEIPASYMLCGHTHKQFQYEYEGKQLINPGSVGVPIGCKKSAHMAVLSWEEGMWKMKGVTLPYDFKRLREEFEASEMKEKAYLWMCCILHSIEDGVNYAPTCVKKAYDLAKQELGNADWNHIPPKYWNLAAKHMGLLD
ncbi:metallophosphoesterase family protein [Anaerosporobacter faecicola]|uniref:metallophosphoesterase family protein n=1 Tax=Anaerosporobacter faecicola TaxID=2718714 RepID=UPI00143BE953|nr:YfcE family phosphodiesterase [Anaerosporobacter faecicola]